MITAPEYSPDPTLTLQQQRVITLLAAGQSITQAAEAENLHRNTIANWRRTVPAFARELEFAQREQRQYWHEQATRLAPLAIQAIEDCLTNPKSSPSLRFRAATLIMKLLADPQTKPTKGFPLQSPQTEALHGEFLQMHKDAQLPTDEEELASFYPRPSAQSAAGKPAQTGTKPQTSRSAPCPCKSGLKYKRCCANKLAQAA
jgi:hypothetical protein